jgi:asparagine synthase (glutamine-hydrolysing)
VSSAALESATRALHHRGPDGRRHWISRDRRVALDHTRLAIIDLSTSAQPIANEDERLQLVANG